MKAKDFRELTPEELRQKEAELKEDLFKLRLRAAVSQLENPMRLRELRRDIARLQTVRRQQGAAKPVPGGA